MFESDKKKLVLRAAFRRLLAKWEKSSPTLSKIYGFIWLL
jgi:hypothetical protein